MKWNQPIVLLVLLLFFISCDQSKKVKEGGDSSPDTQETLLRVNQSLLKEDVNLVKQNAGQRGWKLIESGSGMFYEIYPDSSPQSNSVSSHLIQPGDAVVLNYVIRLLDSTLLYSSAQQGKLSIRVEEDATIAGIHESVQLLKEGDSARIILLPHLAFGLIGDGQLVPPRAILWYEIGVDSVIGK